MPMLRPVLSVLVLLIMLPGCEQSTIFLQDPAGLLSTAQQKRLQEFQRLLHHERDVEFLLVILDQAADDLDRLALDLFAENRLGENTAGARGLLLLIDPFKEQARIEVGYDLEGLLPDAFIAGLEYDQMLPFFQQRRIGHGVEALSELLVARLLEEEPEPVGRNSGEHLSGGAGARISTAGEVGAVEPTPGVYLPQATPLETLAVYRQSLRERSKDPELEIYTPGTREFLRNWLVTDGQQQNALKELERVITQAEVSIRDDLAVIRFPVIDRQAAPYFLRLGSDGWQLDFATMNQSIGLITAINGASVLRHIRICLPFPTGDSTPKVFPTPTDWALIFLEQK